MRSMVAPLQMIVRATGVVLLVLGLLFWSGRLTSLIGLHIVIGVGFVLALCALALLGMRAGPGRVRALGVVTLVWALITWALGYTQRALDPGPSHWTIQTAHLLVGVVAIGLGEMMGSSIRKASSDNAGGPPDEPQGEAVP